MLGSLSGQTLKLKILILKGKQHQEKANSIIFKRIPCQLRKHQQKVDAFSSIGRQMKIRIEKGSLLSQ